MKIRLTHLDGKLPNLALMKLAHWHKSHGDDVWLAHSPVPSPLEPKYDRVYGSAIFEWSKGASDRLQETYPGAVVGGTGLGVPGVTVEEVLGVEEYEHYDYSIYPEYPYSLGFTQRGCRLNCGFCVVPRKEGKPRAVNAIRDIWREGTPRNICLLDNDFFGQPQEQWEARIEEIVAGGFRINFTQGINIRMVTTAAASALAKVKYYDTGFKKRRLYTAWDNLGQEKVFFRGVDLLAAAGIPARHLMVYMLVGYKPGETMDEIMYRYQRLKNIGAKPYPMVYDQSNKQLKRFQRWVIRRYDEVVPWEQFGQAPPKLKSAV